MSFGQASFSEVRRWECIAGRAIQCSSAQRGYCILVPAGQQCERLKLSMARIHHVHHWLIEVAQVDLSGGKRLACVDGSVWAWIRCEAHCAVQPQLVRLGTQYDVDAVSA